MLEAKKDFAAYYINDQVKPGVGTCIVTSTKAGKEMNIQPILLPLQLGVIATVWRQTVLESERETPG